MDVTKISNNNHYSHYKKTISSGNPQNMLHGSNLQSKHSSYSVNGVEVEISSDAKQQYALTIDGLKPTDMSIRKVDAENLEQLRANLPKSKSSKGNTEVEIDPLENDFQIRAVTYLFFANSLDEKVCSQLEGKMINASLFTDQLLQKIRGGSAESTTEERALEREAALKLAEHVAKTYFDNEEEASEFLATVNKVAENSVLREKGYIVFDSLNSPAPFKEYTLGKGAPADYVRVGVVDYAKKYYGIKDSAELLNDPRNEAINKAFTYDMLHNPDKIDAVRKQILKDNTETENKVQSAADKAQKLFSQVTTNDDFISDITDKLNSLNKQGCI